MDIFLFENMCAENESLRGRTVKNITLTANSDKPKLRLNWNLSEIISILGSFTEHKKE